jgi:hypothetical protein
MPGARLRFNHLQQATAGWWSFKWTGMLGQVRDAGREQGDLDLRRSGVAFVGPILLDDVRLSGLEFGDVHSASKDLKTLTLFL